MDQLLPRLLHPALQNSLHKRKGNYRLHVRVSSSLMQESSAVSFTCLHNMCLPRA